MLTLVSLILALLQFLCLDLDALFALSSWSLESSSTITVLPVFCLTQQSLLWSVNSGMTNCTTFWFRRRTSQASKWDDEPQLLESRMELRSFPCNPDLNRQEACDAVLLLRQNLSSSLRSCYWEVHAWEFPRDSHPWSPFPVSTNQEYPKRDHESVKAFRGKVFNIGRCSSRNSISWFIRDNNSLDNGDDVWWWWSCISGHANKELFLCCKVYQTMILNNWWPRRLACSIHETNSVDVIQLLLSNIVRLSCNQNREKGHETWSSLSWRFFGRKLFEKKALKVECCCYDEEGTLGTLLLCCPPVPLPESFSYVQRCCKKK